MSQWGYWARARVGKLASAICSLSSISGKRKSEEKKLLGGDLACIDTCFLFVRIARGWASLVVWDPGMPTNMASFVKHLGYCEAHTYNCKIPCIHIYYQVSTQYQRSYQMIAHRRPERSSGKLHNYLLNKVDFASSSSSRNFIFLVRKMMQETPGVYMHKSTGIDNGRNCDLFSRQKNTKGTHRSGEFLLCGPGSELRQGGS